MSPSVAQQGAVLELELPTGEPCPSCRGAGVSGGALGRCRRCGGRGEVERRVPVRVRVPAGVREGALIPVPTEEIGLMGPPLWLRVRLVG